MGKVKLPYYVVKRGTGYFQPSKTMRAAGFEARSLGPDGPATWAEAQRLYVDWSLHRRGMAAAPPRTYPMGSVGWAWERYRRMEAWAGKAPKTREEWDYAWRWIEPVFGDVAPSTIEIEMVEALRGEVLAQKSLHAAHRVTKIWRALWRVMAAMKLCQAGDDPSLALRNAAPKGRSETWTEGEIARLAKAAWRAGYRGLAAALAVMWDTQFAPGDVRALTPAQRLKDARGTFFDTSRGKTGKEVLGTITRRTERVLDAYLVRFGLSLLDDSAIFRNRSGAPYSSDTIGDDFRDVRAMVFPGDKRQLLDIRRSGAVEAVAGESDASALAAKMGNSIDKSRKLQDTYLPKRAATVRLADEARRRGRRVLRENE